MHFDQSVVESTESYCPDFIFVVADPNDINTPTDPMFQFDGTQLEFIDPNDLVKSGFQRVRAYARYDGTIGGDTSHYDHYATIDLHITLVDKCEQGTLTIPTTIFPDGDKMSYEIGSGTYSINLNSLEVIETETIAPCPDIILSTDADLIDPTIF